MKTRAILALTAVAGLAAAASAQNGLSIRFANGTNAITVAPGTAVPVQVFANVPANGTNIQWTTNGGTGQTGQMAGFNSALFNLNSNGGSWSGNTLGPGMVGPPFGNPGTNGPGGVSGIGAGVGFGSPIAGPSVLIWSGTITVGASDIALNTNFTNVGSPPNGPYQGIEVALSGIIPGLNVTHYLTNLPNATGTITVPAPASLALLGLGGLVAARRRR